MSWKHVTGGVSCHNAWFCACAFATVLCGLLCGCSREKRQEAFRRIENAASAFGSESRPDDVEHTVPNVVDAARKKEIIRNNTEWTPENQALYPIEYCQAQLETIKKYASKLDVAHHKISMSLESIKRKHSEDVARLKMLEKFLDSAKQAYRDAEAVNSWPVTIGGFSLTQENACKKIVEAAHEIEALKPRMAQYENQRLSLQKKADVIVSEQEKLTALKSKVQTTLDDLTTKLVFEGDDSISDAIKVISDSVNVFKVDYEDPSLESMIQPSSDDQANEDFEAIMAN